VNGPAALLDAIVRDALDPSYAEAASRPIRHTPGRTATGMALIAIVGALIGLAVFAQHKSVPQVSAARTALAGDATQRTRDVARLEQALAAEERALADLQRAALQSTAAGRQLAEQEAALSAAIARTPVSGSGVTVTVTDVLTSSAPNAGSRPQGQLAGRNGQVTDRDLQRVVNALWASGATAIAVGGVRLGPQTAIRTAGETILAGFKPLRSPYVVNAIGGAGLVVAAQHSSLLAGPSSLSAGPDGTHPDLTIRAAQALYLPAVTPATAGSVSSARPIAGGHS
jgi:uncharacterized protein YlxW (UPF0749 family)